MEQGEYSKQTRCPYCGKFVSPDADGYYDTEERGADPEFTPVAAFCNEGCACLFHGRPVPGNAVAPPSTHDHRDRGDPMVKHEPEYTGPEYSAAGVLMRAGQ